VEEGDDELLRRCQRGDETALNALLRRYQDRIFRLACRVITDRALASEATAQSLVKIWGRCGQWRGQSAAGTWIYRIAVRTVLDVQRSQSRWWRRWSRPITAEVRDLRPGPEEESSCREESRRREQRVQRALQQLSYNDRVLVHLYYFESQTLGEIEAILGVPKANLKMRLARARTRLRSLLEGTRDA
jgi:RNA polymerase sigma-70 factor (ECF subfamily)